MRLWLPSLLLWLTWVAQCRAAEAGTELRVSNDGIASFSAASGATTWTGTMTMDHPRFHLVAKGTASLFGGPALRRSSAPDVPLNAATFKPETQWISLVVLGAIAITVHDGKVDSAVLTAQRVVYVPVEDRLLIDGKRWVPRK